MSADGMKPDTDAEAVDNTPTADRRASPPPDRPGVEGYPSRAESRRGAAAANEITPPAGDTESRAGDEERATDRSPASRPVADKLVTRDHSAKDSSETTDEDDDASGEAFKETATKTELGRPSTVEAQETPDYESPEQLVARRAGELQEQLPEKSRGRVTMAVGVVEVGNGDKTTVVGTSEPRGYLRPGVSLEEGEVVAPGNGHAETDIIDWAEQREQRVITIGAGRPICPACAGEIRRVDAQPATRLKEEK